MAEIIGSPVQEEEIRLLICFDCMTVEPLPPYLGPRKKDNTPVAPDPELEHLLRPHRTDGLEHVGRLMGMTLDTYEALKRSGFMDLRKQLNTEDPLAFRDTLTEDATKCFNRHRRPTQPGCVDYMTDAKLLANPGGIRYNDGSNSRYLCHYCPYHHGVVVPIRRKDAGQYE